MSTLDKFNDLAERRRKVELGGGQAAIDKQHAAGKQTARERLTMLFDENSFVEIDSYVETRTIDFDMQKKKAPGDGVVTGYGTVDGRLVYAAAQDFTFIGGALGGMHAQKITKVMDMAVKMGAPFISMNDSGGARIQEGLDSLCGYGEIFYRNTRASGVIPQISVIMGPCAGGAVYSPAITDFIFMLDKTSYMCITGAEVIKAVTGENVTTEGLGGSGVHTAKSGVAHFRFSEERACIDGIKRLLSFLPDNNLSGAPEYECTDDINRLDDELNELIPDDPNKPYNMKDVILRLADNGDFQVLQKKKTKNIIIGFARFNGRSVGIIANQPAVMAGSLDYNASDKAARFIRFCDSFNIPILTLTDVPGYLPGVEQEHGGVIRHGAKLLYAFSEATVPKINVILRKAYGGAYIAMNSKHLGADIVLAWPTAEIAVMGADGAANIIFRKEIAAAEDPVETRKEKIEEYRTKFSNPFVAASKGYVDDVIEPGSTRVRIISALEMLMNKRESGPSRKHGNIPL
jgi:acetyl-CoA carboxylase carboxyltransferase component